MCVYWKDFDNKRYKLVAYFVVRFTDREEPIAAKDY